MRGWTPGVTIIDPILLWGRLAQVWGRQSINERAGDVVQGRLRTRTPARGGDCVLFVPPVCCKATLLENPTITKSDL
jgi:hypothetical protein